MLFLALSGANEPGMSWELMAERSRFQHKIYDSINPLRMA